MNSLPPYAPHSVGEKAAHAAYAVLRAHNLIPAGDWTIPHEIGAEAQAMFDKTGAIPWPTTVPAWPSKPFNADDVWVIPVVGGATTCGKCGMRWEGAMGYVCPDNHCPVQLKAWC